MFERFQPTPEDPIIKITSLCKADPRAEKIDMGVGVFRDENGNTPIMQAVSEAEKQLHKTQTSKAYVGLAGDENFNQQMIDLIFANHPQKHRIRGVQTPGGCGALRMLSDMLYKITADNTVWASDPTWGNHYPIFQSSGFNIQAYPYLNRDKKTVDIDQLMNKLQSLGSNDILLLHGCCHNPSGAELQPEDWDNIAEICAKNGIFPYVDLAYLGFGDSLQADAYGVRKLADSVESMVVAASCSKNFGLYRDRVGCSLIIGETSESADIARSHLLSTARSSYSMPPDHGAAIVANILSTPDMRKLWEDELTTMRNRMLDLRMCLKNMLQTKTNSNRWDFIANHRGMFSLLVLSDQQVDTLRTDHAVYVVQGGRINIAGIKDEQQLERFADALVAVTS